MLSHLNSVTGVPVCHYLNLSCQPLRGEFNKILTVSRTIRHLSVSKAYCILLRLFAFTRHRISFFIHIVNTKLQFTNVCFRYNFKTGICKCCFCSFIILYTNNNISVFFSTSHKSVQVFHIDFVFIKNF